jgi:oxygen-independent coproporphyrinogen-3 oxidase
MSEAAVVDGAAAERAAYVHIPFCRRRCPYCDFAVVDMSRAVSPIDRYVDALVAEIAMEREWQPLHAVNFGGGTPSALSVEQIGSVLQAISSRFGLVDGAEISLEANPEDWIKEYAGRLRQVGVNRVSLGVQSFDDDVLASLGREHTARQGAQAVANARAVDFPAVNLDLIFGTPGESMESWLHTVDLALELQTEHLSAYALTVELGTDLSRAVAAGAPEPDGDDQADKYEALVDAADGQLRHYEVSNWAAPGRECRYNLTTWAQGEYLAFGLGAHSHRDGVRRRNARRLDVYLEMVEGGTRPEAGRESLNAWEKDKERVFLGLRRRAGVPAGKAGDRLLQSEEGMRFLSAGVVELVGDRLVVTNPLLTDAVARELLALEPPRSE